MKYSSLMLFYFVISFELLSMQQQIKTSSLGDLDMKITDEVVINFPKSKSLRNSRNFKKLDLEDDIEPDFSKYGGNEIRQLPKDVTPEIAKLVIAAHKLLVNDINSNVYEPSNQENVQQQKFNLAQYQMGKILIKSEDSKDISPATSKRIKYLTTGSKIPNLAKLRASKIKNGKNTKNRKNGAHEKNEKNGKIN